ncbi:ABC transporter permease [Hyalangium sp.]|uniref:ABC transporter permease n=1 Tax=Hyalangium sp. TaxID=2028555 RepID=UPI002D45667E|nr:ABC transporter permease [Hyalangium sp.]HYH95617.1 ABC transporter permease [Hyalangium sp.]
MSDLRDDLRFAARLFRKSPGFTAVAMLSLALAIGANTAIFSVVNGVLLQPLPFPEPHRLFRVIRHDPGRDEAPLSAPQYAFLLRQEQPFSALAAWPVTDSGFNLSGEGAPERLTGTRVTRSFFEVFGLTPVLGRGFLPEEDVPGGPRVVVLGHALWQRLFQGDPDAVGRSLELNGEPYTVVGVAPPGFDYPGQSQLWVPLRLDRVSIEDTHYLMVAGRLRPGVDPAQVGALVTAQGEQLRASRPGAVRTQHWLDAGELQTLRVRGVRPALLMLLGAVGLVLLIACVNLANLQLARASSRERELAVRTALGARPARIAQQLLTESVLLSGAGGVVGLVLAAWGLPALLALVPEGVPLPERIHIDGAVLAFTLGVSMLAGLLFGVLPAWQATRMDPGGSLQVGVPRRALRGSGSRTRWMLVVSQVALAIILLVGASLLAKSFFLVRGVPPGFDAREVLTMKLPLPEGPYGRPEALEAFAETLMARVRALPKVQAVGFAFTLPLEAGIRLDLTVEGRPPAADTTGHGLMHYRPVASGYFDALKIELVRGRLLNDRDRHGGKPVALINEAAARRYWPGEEPLGQRISLGRSIPQIADPEPREIIGVVSDVRELGLHEEPQPIVYVPLGQMPAPFLARFMRLFPQSILVRSSGELGPLAEAVTREAWTVNPALPVTGVMSLETILSRSMDPRRFNTLLLGLMAGLALVLAAVGLYGVLSYRVNQRTREIGVRMALGATRGAVVWLVVRQGMSAAGVGAVLGLWGASELTWLLDQLLYGVSPVDPGVFLAAPAVLMGVALVATWLPAFRASRVDPMVALRSE